MDRTRRNQEQAATAAATSLQGLGRNVRGKPQNLSTLHHRPQNYSYVPRSEYGRGGVLGMNPSAFPRGGSAASLQPSTLFGLDGLQRRTQGWGKLVDGARWPGDGWNMDSSVSPAQSGGGSDAGASGSEGLSDGRADADIKMNTEDVQKQAGLRATTSTHIYPIESNMRQTIAQGCKASGDGPGGGADHGGVQTQLPEGARAKEGGRPGLSLSDIGHTYTAEALASPSVPSSSAPVDQKVQEQQTGFRSPISGHPPSLPRAKPYHHPQSSTHNASQIDIASPPSSTTRNINKPGDCASKFPNPISPSRSSSIPALHPSATTPSSPSVNSWPSLSPNATSLPRHRADAPLHLGHPQNNATSSSFSQSLLPHQLENEDKMPASDHLYGAFKAKGGAGMRELRAEHDKSTASGGDDIYNASDDDEKPTFGIQTERRLVSQVFRNNKGDYYLDRGHGRCTKLIPADMLPPLVDVPAIQISSSDMTILPVPPAAGRTGRSVYLHPVETAAPLVAPTAVAKVIPAKDDDTGSSTPGSPDNVQSRIDDIVASQPESKKKKVKVYCDKWVHDGVCAFTQQGCRYKHEMPYDRATQVSLGLFQGFPSWWRRHQAELQGPPQGSGAIMGAQDGEQTLLMGSRALGGVRDAMSPPPGPHGAQFGQMMAVAADRQQQVRELPWRRQVEAPAPHAQAAISNAPAGRDAVGFPIFPAPAQYNTAGRGNSGPGAHWGAVGSPVPHPLDVTSGDARARSQQTPELRGRLATANMFGALQSSPESLGSTDSSRGFGSGAKLTNPHEEI